MDYYHCIYCKKKTSYEELEFRISIKIDPSLTTTLKHIIYAVTCAHCDKVRRLNAIRLSTVITSE